MPNPALTRSIHSRAVTFGQTIRRAREKRGYARQSDLAKVLGVSQQTVSRWEAGEVPRLTTLARLSEVLDVPLKRLYVYAQSGTGRTATLAERVKELELLAQAINDQVAEVKRLVKTL